MPQHSSTEISPAFNNVSSLIDRVKTVPLPGGESYKRPYVVSYGDGAGSTNENADYNVSEPEFNYAEIVREKITAYAEEPEEMVKLPDADYDSVVEESVTPCNQALRIPSNFGGTWWNWKIPWYFFQSVRRKRTGY